MYVYVCRILGKRHLQRILTFDTSRKKDESRFMEETVIIMVIVQLE